jgi:hypothetical protein
MKIAMYAFAVFTALSPLAGVAAADQKSDRGRLVGSWVQNRGTNAWVFKATDNGLHVTQFEKSKPVADFQCETSGQNCEVKISGHKATVSMYYNGSELVQLEKKGDETVERRFSILSSGNSMKVEVTPMTGQLRTQEEEFERGEVPGQAR